MSTNITHHTRPRLAYEQDHPHKKSTQDTSILTHLASIMVDTGPVGHDRFTVTLRRSIYHELLGRTDRRTD